MEKALNIKRGYVFAVVLGAEIVGYFNNIKAGNIAIDMPASKKSRQYIKLKSKQRFACAWFACLYRYHNNFLQIRATPMPLI